MVQSRSETGFGLELKMTPSALRAAASYQCSCPNSTHDFEELRVT